MEQGRRPAAETVAPEGLAVGDLHGLAGLGRRQDLNAGQPPMAAGRRDRASRSEQGVSADRPDGVPRPAGHGCDIGRIQPAQAFAPEPVRHDEGIR